jgi:serine/threonine protein kinase
LSDFKIVKLIGQGGFGKVYLVKRQGTSTHYAMKVLRKDFIMQQD